jgi:site-specific recombinase XerD
MNLFNCLELYIKYLKYEKNLSLNSINSYWRDNIQFLEFLKSKNITETSNLNLDIFRDFLKYIDSHKYSNKTIVRKYSSLVNFFKFMEVNDYINFQITQFINVPRVRQGLYSFMSINEISRMFDNFKPSSDLEIRDRAILEVIYSTGARVSEVENLKIKDIDTAGREAVVTGKGRKQRFVYLNRSAVFWVEKYLEVRNRLVYSNAKEKYRLTDYLFLNKSGSRLSSRSIRNIVKKYARSSATGKNITPHSIRHSFATHLLQEGAGIREIQELLGHENISTTQIYSHLNIKKLKEDYKKFHPRAEGKRDKT